MQQSLVLITGSAGLIGSALCDKLKERYTTIGLDREGRPYPPESAEWIFVDLTSDESVMNALHAANDLYGGKIASVCHLAAYYDFSGEPSDLYERVTIRGTERLMRELDRFFAVEQFIFSSTMIVHKPTEPGKPINEDWPLEPKWDYPKSKVETENLLLAHHGDVPLVLMRIAGVYDEMCHSIPIAHQIKRIYEKDFTSHMYPGDLRRGQSFIHLDDLLNAFVKAIDKRKSLPHETTLLIGEPETLGYGEMQDLIGHELYGTDWDTQTVPKPFAKAGAAVQDALSDGEAFIKPWMIDMADDHYELDIGRAKDLLDWHPRRKLEKVVPKMIANLKKDPLAWYRANKLEVPPWFQTKSA